MKRKSGFGLKSVIHKTTGKGGGGVAGKYTLYNKHIKLVSLFFFMIHKLLQP